METKDGGPAFPGPGKKIRPIPNMPALPGEPETGMSLRAWFAGQAIMSFRLNISATADEVDVVEAAEKTAFYALLIADAMLAELAKGSA